MKHRHLGLMVLVVAWSWTQGCQLATPTGICELRTDEIRIFPVDGASNIPPNMRVRAILSAEDAPRTDPILLVPRTGEVISTSVIETPTAFGTVLEVVPDLELPTLERLEVQLVDRDSGALVALSSFDTGAFIETGPPTGEGTVSIGSVQADERRCCGARGCRDGAAISTPRIVDGTASPQLVLLEIEEVTSTTCGASAELVDIVPVVQEGDLGDDLDAESDLALAGCFQVTVRDQYGRVGQPDGVTCTDGFVFEPGNRDSCRSTSGCAIGAAPNFALMMVALLALGWLARRRRVLRGR